MSNLYVLTRNQSDWQKDPGFYDMVEELGFKKVEWKPPQNRMRWRCARSNSCDRKQRLCIYHEILKYCASWEYLKEDAAKQLHKSILENRTKGELNSITSRWLKCYKLMADPNVDPRRLCYY